VVCASNARATRTLVVLSHLHFNRVQNSLRVLERRYSAWAQRALLGDQCTKHALQRIFNLTFILQVF